LESGAIGGDVEKHVWGRSRLCSRLRMKATVSIGVSALPLRMGVCGGSARGLTAGVAFLILYVHSDSSSTTVLLAWFLSYYVGWRGGLLCREEREAASRHLMHPFRQAAAVSLITNHNVL